MTSTLADWLGSLDAEGLARLLAHRPETARPPLPRSLRELAERLAWPTGAQAALHSVPLPATQLIEAILGTQPPTRDAVAEALGVDVDALDAPLRPLLDRALVWPDGEKLRVLTPLAEATSWPLGLGRSVGELIGRWPAAELAALANNLGVPAAGRRADMLAALTGWYADAERVRVLVAGAPEATVNLLAELTWHGPEVQVPGLLHGGSAERIPGPVGWAVRHGLLVVTSWHEAQVPREVALALRGPDWRPPLDLAPPVVPLVAVEPAAVSREATAAASAALDQIAAVGAECGRTPLAVLKTGGIGVRELRRLAKALGAQPHDVSLWLELALAAGLLAQDPEGVLPTPGYDKWCAAEPAERLVTILRAWWRLRALPNWPEREAPPAALRVDGLGALLVRARQEVLGLAAGYPPGQAVADLGALESAVAWRLPVLLVGLAPIAENLAALWREARLLGLVAHDSASDFGRALAAGDLDALLATARQLLEAPTVTAIFQADLTVVVPGSPAAALAELLDASADREARGAASTWRFTAGSVRRALDAGYDATELTGALAAAAVGGALPQGLTYLIADAARRHGQLRVRAVQCVLHAEDPALLAEVVATRSLAPLRLSVLAPTVLGSAGTVDATLAALRSAGYAPVGEDSDGAPVLDRLPRLRARTPKQLRRTPPDDHLALAKALLGKGNNLFGEAVAPVLQLRRTAPDSPTTLQVIAEHTAHLPQQERHLLAEAIDHDEELEIGYLDSTGKSTRRVIEQLELDGDSIVAWCRLRDDERRFLLARITSVEAV